MGGGHSHGPTGHAGGRHRGKLAIAFAIIATFFVVELIAGIAFQSLALLSDAGHMAADVVALGAALVATRVATRPDSTGRRTYGSYRAEVFASGLTVLIMLGVSVYVLIEALGRIGEDVSIQTGPMMIVGALGLAANLVVMQLLRAGSKESLNVKGAYFEVVADTAGSVGVIIAGALVAFTGSPWWDTGVAVAIAIFVAVRAVILGREVLTVLGQHAPAGVDPAQVEEQLAALPGVSDVHDLHLWTLTSGMNVATAHLLSTPGADHAVVLDQAQELLRDDFGVEHATLQVERTSEQCSELSW
ncbi:cation diffusion facilitator family transporter [Dermacoccaceae bacterium W4C1]